MHLFNNTFFYIEPTTETCNINNLSHTSFSLYLQRNLLTSLLPHISPSLPFSGLSRGLSHLAGGIKRVMTWDQADKD